MAKFQQAEFQSFLAGALDDDRADELAVELLLDDSLFAAAEQAETDLLNQYFRGQLTDADQRAAAEALIVRAQKTPQNEGDDMSVLVAFAEIRLLLDEALCLAPVDARQSVELSRQARERCIAIPKFWAKLGGGGTALLVRAVAFEGNGQRVLGDLRKSASRFLEVRRMLAVFGAVDLDTIAWVDRTEAKLLEALGRFDEAEALLRRALGLFEQDGNVEQARWARLNLAIQYEMSGELERAVGEAELILAEVTARQDKRLVLYTRQNLAFWLYRLGSHRRARESYEDCQELYADFDEEPLQIRRQWLMALLEKQAGTFASAMKHLKEAQDRFVLIGQVVDGGIVALERAVFLLEKGQSAEVKVIAASLIPIFQEKEVHPEALAAMILFEKAASAEKASEQMIQQLSRFLNQSRQNPELRFSWQPE